MVAELVTPPMVKLAVPGSAIQAASVGGAAGNTICVHNVVAASAVVGLTGREAEVIRKTLLVFLYYVTLAGAVSLFVTT